jgi:diacylglycerol kinase (ATP)
MSAPVILLLINANARAFVKEPLLAHKLKDTLCSQAHVFITHHADELVAIAHFAKEHHCNYIVLCGGDGTYSAGLTAFYHVYNNASPAPAPLPIFAFGPGGTVRIAAKNIGVSMQSDVLSEVRSIVHRIITGDDTIVFHPTLSVQANNNNNRKQIAFTFGTGLVASFFQVYDSPVDAKNKALDTGNTKAFKILAKVFLQSMYNGPFARQILDPLPCSITVDSQTIAWPASSLVLTSVLKNVGIGLQAAYRAGEDWQKIHAVISGLSPAQLGPRMFRVFAGQSIKKHKNEPHFDDLVHTMQVSFAQSQGPYVVDGDLLYANHICISAGPVVRFVI